MVDVPVDQSYWYASGTYPVRIRYVSGTYPVRIPFVSAGHHARTQVMLSFLGSIGIVTSTFCMILRTQELGIKM